MLCIHFLESFFRLEKCIMLALWHHSMWTNKLQKGLFKDVLVKGKMCCLQEQKATFRATVPVTSEITTLKVLNTNHLFPMTALKNLQLFMREHFNKGDSGTFILLSFQKQMFICCWHTCHYCLAEKGLKQESQQILQSHVKHLSPDKKQVNLI